MRRRVRPLHVALYAATALSAGVARATEVDEIIVTATRQDRAIDKVPVSVAALTGARMDVLRVKSIADIARMTPGLSFDPADNSLAIRGVDSEAGAATTGVYIDDTPIQIRSIGTLPGATLPSLFDLERVEVIRGPQGTLFGAGAEGGAVRYITRKPNLWSADGQVQVEATTIEGGAPGYEAGAAYGAPIVEGRLGFRLSAWTRHEGGWVDRIDYRDGSITDANANSVDSLALRAVLGWAPTPQLTITPSVLFQSRLADDTDTWWEGLSDPSAGRFRNGNPVRLTDDDHFVLPALRVEYDAGPVKLIANSAYFWRRQKTYYDASVYNLSWLEHETPQRLLTPTGFNIPLAAYVAPGEVINKQLAFTQELRVQSADPAARLTWTAGFYWSRSRQGNSETLVDPQFEELTQAIRGMSGLEAYGYGLIGDASYIGEFTAYDRQIALFGEAAYRIAPGLNINFGLRVSRTRFSFTNHQDGPYNAPGPSSGAGGQDETPVTPKVALTWAPDDYSLYYLTVAKGYRIGGANVPLPPQFCGDALAMLKLKAAPTTYKSDSVWTWEAGIKRHTPGRRLEWAASAYRLTWSDIQQRLYLPACGFAYTDNFGTAVSQGFDLQLTARPTDRLTLNASIGYVDARYTADSLSSPVIGAPILARDGDALPGSPWTAAADFRYAFRLADHDSFAQLSYQYNSKGRTPEPGADPATVSYDMWIPAPEANHAVQARIGMRADTWSIEAYIDNLLDAHPLLRRTHEDQDTLLTIGRTVRPRSFGISLARRF
jgi:iron complex outermembrane receptor protein